MSNDSSLPPFDYSQSFKHTAPPNPSFKYHDPTASTELGKKWTEGQKEGWKVIDTEKESTGQLYKLMISGIVPRPIAFVSTLSQDSIPNLSPFSWFNQVSANPPIISISIAATTNPDGSKHDKDTAGNIKATKEFTVNLISEPFIEGANVTSVDAPPGVSEWEISGLNKAETIHVKPPRVLESAFSMECTLHQAIDITDPVTGKLAVTLVLGYVRYIHVRNDVLTEKGTVDPGKLRPVGRLGDVTYARVGDGFRLERPAWDEEKGKMGY